MTLGDIARLRAQAGDVAGAFKLHEEELRTFEQLGDVGSRASTLGDIARLRAQAGDVAEARRLNEERLEIQRSLGDLGEIAAALFDLAQIDLGEEKLADAAPRLAESWSLFNKIGRADGIAIVGQLLGSLLASAGLPQARDVLLSSKEAFLKLGMDSEASAVDKMIQQIPPSDSNELG